MGPPLPLLPWERGAGLGGVLLGRVQGGRQSLRAPLAIPNLALGRQARLRVEVISSSTVGPGLRACVSAQLLSCIQLFETPETVGPPGSSVHGILQARILGRVTISSSGGYQQKKTRNEVDPNPKGGK